jgi:hypothetical protein
MIYWNVGIIWKAASDYRLVYSWFKKYVNDFS